MLNHESSKRLGGWVLVDQNHGSINDQKRRASNDLSNREMEVAELIARGLRNPEIAGRLYIGRPTVASHIAHILEKLGFQSRTQIAAWIVENRRRNSNAPD